MRKIISIIVAFALCLCSTAAVFAAADPYNIISPQTSSEGVAYGDNLLISVRVEEDTSLIFTLYSYPNYFGGASLTELPASDFTEQEQLGDPETVPARERISFYTRQLKGIDPGLYSLRIDTVDENGSVVTTQNKYFIAKPNSEKVATTIYESKPSSKVLFFQSVFKSLFGSTED